MEAIVIGTQEEKGRLWNAIHGWQHSHNYLHGELVSHSHPLVPSQPEGAQVITLNPHINDCNSIVEGMARAAGVSYYRRLSA